MFLGFPDLASQKTYFVHCYVILLTDLALFSFHEKYACDHIFKHMPLLVSIQLPRYCFPTIRPTHGYTCKNTWKLLRPRYYVSKICLIVYPVRISGLG